MNPADGTPTAKTLTGLKALDANTLQVTLIDPFIDFVSMIGYTAFLPLPKAAFDSNGAVKSGFEDHMIGDGPFKLTPAGWQHNKEIDMVKNDTFTGPKPKVAAVDLKSYLSLSTAYQDVLADKLDVLPQLATSDLATATSDFGDRYKNSPRSAFEFLAFPTYDKAFSNVNVRRAISMAIDRNAQTKVIFNNSQTPARSFVSPVLPGYRPDVCGTACVYNPTAAKALYTANNGPSQIQISYNADGGHKEWVDATCNELQQNLGVQCISKPEAKFADLLTKVEAKTPGVGMFRLGWVMDFPSMEDYLGPLYTTHGASNYYGYSNPTFDKLVAEGSAQLTQNAAIAKWQQAENILAQDLPVLPMRFGQNNYVISTFVSDVFVDLFSAVDLYTIQTSRQ
jgi:peptide/nickel transport system substrate-binding protein/oligopeptide transport system substrate-binding protein